MTEMTAVDFAPDHLLAGYSWPGNGYILVETAANPEGE
jgi:hypothetical protein